MSALPPEWLGHLSMLTSFRLGACDRGGQPHVCRALAVDALPDGRMLALVAEPSAPRVVAALRETGQAALLMTAPSSNRTLHVKGRDARVEPALPEHAALLARCQRRLTHDIGEVDGFASASFIVAHWFRMELHDMVAVRFDLSGAWNQTPGPDAGQPIALQP